MRERITVRSQAKAIGTWRRLGVAVIEGVDKLLATHRGRFRHHAFSRLAAASLKETSETLSEKVENAFSPSEFRAEE